MAKTKDLFLNIAANPNMTLEDLASVGLTSENTMLLDRAQYASNEKVQDMFRDSEGNFDEQKFNAFYDIAEQSYNILANDEANLNLMNVTAYDSDNIFVDPSKRRRNNAPIAVKLPNPDRLNVSINRIGKIGPRTLSQDEIAQTQQVLLNPTDVANGAEPIYGNAPNDSWFEDFWDTRVMAAWDEDGTHIDPVTGQEVSHKKGDLKLNENGTYYYESLDGRSVYGKRVLNKFNTLTTDGSSWNKYDFFDSDSIEQKSIGGSVLKNLALVGSMFIPYVGWGVAAASVAHQMAGLTATFGKMLAGSDSPTLDAIEGWVKSTDRRNLKTEYAQQNTWCWENFIDLIGDTTAQLREQRAIFKFAPGLIKGDFKALNDKAMDAYKAQLAKEGMENVTNKSFMDLARLAQKQNPENWKEQLKLLMGETKGVFSAKAEKQVRDYLNSYYKLGEPIAKAYMTAITVQDTFGEAIQAGATDTEATLLTLGYAAAEAALLSTDLGKWIMPELRTERLRNKMIAKKLLELPQETREMSRQLSRLDGESKKDWAKRLFNVGKDIANAEYSMMPKTVGSVLASGLGEGVEEVSEEALADFSKSCFNLVQQLQGDDVRLNAWNHNWDWSEAASRYGMSFAGGIIGGGINAAASDYKANREILNMNSQQAMQQLVYMARNNELDDFWKVIDKTTLASKELSTQLNDNGIGYKPGTKDDNQDLAAKKALRKQVDLINSILNAENAKLDDNGLLSALIKADPSLRDMDPVKEYRMRALSNSATAGRFLNEWNTVNSDIIKNRIEQSKILARQGDSAQLSEEDNQQLQSLGQDLKALQERKDQMLDGTRTREYIRDALFEMTHSVNELFNKLATEVQYAEAKTGKKYKDLSEDEKKNIHEKYTAWKNSNQYAEKVHELADIYETMAITASQGLQASADYYEQVRQNNYQNLTQLNQLAKKRLAILNQKAQDTDQGTSMIQSILNNEYQDDLVVFNDSQQLLDNLNNIELNTQNKIDQIVLGRSEEELTDQDRLAINTISKEQQNAQKIVILNSVFDKISATYDEFIKAGFIHPESKEMLSQMLTSLRGYSNLAGDEYYDSDPDLSDLYYERMSEIDAKVEEIEKLSNTPLIENLRQFQPSTDTDKSVLDLIEHLILTERSNKQDISGFQLDKATLDLFDEAKNLLEMYRTAIVGARFDNVDLDNIVGFNTTLNEISGAEETPQLAEIDAQTADLAIDDINKLLKRLEYAKNLHGLNTGNKYNVQAKTALNKQFILHNKIRSFVSILQDDDEWKDKDSQTSLKELQEALATASTLNQSAGRGKYEERVFTLNSQQKEEIERESINIQEKLHNFLNDRIDGSEESINKLAKLLTYDNFKGLIRENNDFLNQDSTDIDDSAFIWWLCATAALSPDQFYNNYRTILGTEEEGEKPIAPIPTQELGVFALTAAITNGDMFRTFGKAMRKSLTEFWNSKTDEERKQISKDAGISFLMDNNKKFFKNNDFLPNFDNIVFVEGIAGSGKSTGVLITLSKLLAKTNPDLVNQKIIFAHTDKTKAQTLAETTAFTNFDTHDHDSLLSWMSPDYKPQTSDDGKYVYTMDQDVKLVDGILRGNWNINVYNPNDVPKFIIIDEWSHYNQLEQDLIQRFAQAYGTTVMSMGDYDQLTPESTIILDPKNPTNTEKQLSIIPNRNMTPRVAKLGVSMRTDNEIKNGNMYRMLAWRHKPVRKNIELHYYEDETGIYGDKSYNVGTTYGSELDKIKLDVKKMISTLKPNEQIGYIYHDKNSELYKWLTTTEGVKEHVIPKIEKDAHGQEAQYYIVENNRSASQDALQYFNSVYTGITRSEQGSIVITNSDYIRNTANDSVYNTEGIRFDTIQDFEMLPNTFTDAGTREFTNKRKQTLNNIFKDKTITPFEIKERTRERVEMNRDSENKTDPVIDTPVENISETSVEQNSEVPENTISENVEPETTQDSNTPPLTEENDPGLPPPPPEDYDYSQIDLTERKPKVEPSVEELGDTRTPEESQETWTGPLPKNQKLYSPNGDLKYIIEGETDSDYILRDINNYSQKSVSKDTVQNNSYLKLPEKVKLFNVGDKFTYQGVTEHTIKSIKLYGDLDNPTWLYATNYTDLTQEELEKLIKEGKVKKSEKTPVSEEIPVELIAEELEGRNEYESDISEEVKDDIPETVTGTADNLDFNIFGFTFNNSYVADEFDDDNNIVPTQDDRIDNGYGLNKINKNAFKNYKDLKKALGSIRRHLYYSSNTDILKHLQGLIRQREYMGLSMRWAFISKSNSKPRNDRWSRYNVPKTLLEYMNKEDGYMPLKTISAIIYDKFGNPVLELPVITLQSPHSIFRELLAKKVGKDITDLWTFGPKEEGQTFKELNDILNLINSKYTNNPNYQKLGGLIKMWLFTSNGVQLLPDGWNLHQEVDNLGNLYITERYSDNIVEHNYYAEWNDLATLEREDRFISSIMMNNKDVYIDQLNNTPCDIFRRYTPYVFISDSPTIKNDEDAAKQYLKQQADPTLEKVVKVVPVSPPEVSVSDYINAMNRIKKRESKNEPYGNAYSAYRIWNAVLNSPQANQVLAPLKDEVKKQVLEFIEALNKIKDDNPQRNGESNLEYKKRIAKLQNKYHKDNGNIVFTKLREALVESVFHQKINDDTEGNSDILKAIQQACDSHNITGVLCKPTFVKEQKGQAIGGFAYRVKVDDKYKFPGHGSFRIFGKIDPPTYNMNNMSNHLQHWAKNAHKGKTFVNPETGEEVTFDNIWYFEHDHENGYYLPKVGQSSFKLEPVVKYGEELLAKLGIRDYNIDTAKLSAYKSAEQARKELTRMINKKFTEKPGTFILDINGQFKYGDITEQLPEFSKFKFKQVLFNQGTYFAEFYNVETNTLEQIEIGLDLNNNKFLVRPLQSPTSNQSSIKVSEIIDNVNNLLNGPILGGDPIVERYVKDILNLYNPDNNQVDIAGVEALLDSAEKSGEIDEFTVMGLKIELKLDELKGEKEQDVCINPIKISFK